VIAVHHSAICTRDLEVSLRFWRDGMDLAVLMDHEFDGDWPALFGARGTRLRAVFLGDPSQPDTGIVELVSFPDGIDDGEPSSVPATGFFLLSLYVDVESTLARLAELGLGGEPTLIEQMGVAMATVRDPNGVLVELIDGARARR